MRKLVPIPSSVDGLQRRRVRAMIQHKGLLSVENRPEHDDQSIQEALNSPWSKGHYFIREEDWERIFGHAHS